MVIDINSLIGGVVTIVVAIFGSTGFWQWVSNNSSKGIKKAIEAIKAEIDSMKKTENEKEARAARRRILRFNDELLNQRDLRHSKEMFDDVLDDVNQYRAFCRENPDFINSKCTLAIENVERVYRNCTQDGTFL
jgi:hypothetical protein